MNQNFTARAIGKGVLPAPGLTEKAQMPEPAFSEQDWHRFLASWGRTPVDSANFKPDVVLIAAKPAQAMLIYEAAIKAGAGNALTNVLGRPACAVLPLTTNNGQTSISLGCKGNRTFTGLADEEVYVAIPGDKWADVIEKLTETHAANLAMERYYSNRKTEYAAPGTLTK